jgi:hypothetical protein
VANLAEGPPSWFSATAPETAGRCIVKLVASCPGANPLVTLAVCGRRRGRIIWAEVLLAAAARALFCFFDFRALEPGRHYVAEVVHRIELGGRATALVRSTRNACRLLATQAGKMVTALSLKTPRTDAADSQH